MSAEDPDQGKPSGFERHIIHDQDQTFEPRRVSGRNQQRHPEVQQPRPNVNGLANRQGRNDSRPPDQPVQSLRRVLGLHLRR